MYLDPGSWSLLVQIIIGTLVAVPALVGVYWRQIKSLFTRGRNAKDR